MRKLVRDTRIFLVLLWLVLTVGVFTVNAGWQRFGGGNNDGRSWSWEAFDICLDAIRIGFSTNVYYNVDINDGEQPDEAVAAYLSINNGFPEENELLVPHKVHPPRQPAPLLVVPEPPSPQYEDPYWTILNVPFATVYETPFSFADYNFVPLGTSGGGSTYEGSDYTMGDCFLRKGVYNGGFEVPLAGNKKFPAGWNRVAIGVGDRVKCDKVKRDNLGFPDNLPDKFFSFEGGIVNPGEYVDPPSPPDPPKPMDPDTDPGCAFQFTGAPGKVSRLTQKRKNVEGFDSGDAVTLRAYVYGKGTNAKEKVVVKTVIKYVGGGKTVIRALPEPGVNINEGYTLYTAIGTLTGEPRIIRNVIGFAGTSGRVFIDGVHMRVDNGGLPKLANPEIKWLSLPDAPSGK